jgi:hypothetical protein
MFAMGPAYWAGIISKPTHSWATRTPIMNRPIDFTRDLEGIKKNVCAVKTVKRFPGVGDSYHWNSL